MLCWGFQITIRWAIWHPARQATVAAGDARGKRVLNFLCPAPEQVWALPVDLLGWLQLSRVYLPAQPLLSKLISVTSFSERPGRGR